MGVRVRSPPRAVIESITLVRGQREVTRRLVRCLEEYDVPFSKFGARQWFGMHRIPDIRPGDEHVYGLLAALKEVSA